MNYKGYEVTEDGRVFGKNGKELGQYLFKKHLCVYIEKRKQPVHRLVAMCFVPNPDNKPEIHHIDHNATKNVASNLMWVTRKEHQAIHRGEINPRSKLDWDKADYIRANPNKSTNALAEELGVTAGAVSLVKHNRSWKLENHP